MRTTILAGLSILALTLCATTAQAKLIWDPTDLVGCEHNFSSTDLDATYPCDDGGHLYVVRVGDDFMVKKEKVVNQPASRAAYRASVPAAPNGTTSTSANGGLQHSPSSEFIASKSPDGNTVYAASYQKPSPCQASVLAFMGCSLAAAAADGVSARIGYGRSGYYNGGYSTYVPSNGYVRGGSCGGCQRR